MSFTELVDTRYGRMLVNRNDLYVGPSLKAYGEFSPGEQRAFRGIIRPDWVVVEAGANIGAHTLCFANLASHVIAFEPQRIVFQMLCANAALNSLTNVLAVQAALGDREGEIAVPVPLQTSTGNFGAVSLVRNVRPEHQTETVPVHKLDSLGLLRCDFLKVDVEGMEAAVFRGAEETIARFRPVIWFENQDNEDKDALIRQVSALGYNLWWQVVPFYDSDNWRGEPENIFGTVSSFNMVAFPKESQMQVPDMEQAA